MPKRVQANSVFRGIRLAQVVNDCCLSSAVARASYVEAQRRMSTRHRARSTGQQILRDASPQDCRREPLPNPSTQANYPQAQLRSIDLSP